MAVTGDDKYIISGSDDKTIAVWDIANKIVSTSTLTINSVAVMTSSGSETRLLQYGILPTRYSFTASKMHTLADKLSGGDRR